MENAFAQHTDLVLAGLGVDAANGLTDEQVLASRAKHGKNGKSLCLVADPSFLCCFFSALHFHLLRARIITCISA